MSKLILARRKFLFLAPAIVAAASLMPGHSIAHLLPKPKYPIIQAHEYNGKMCYTAHIGNNHDGIRQVQITKDEYEWHRSHILKFDPPPLEHRWAWVTGIGPLENGYERLYCGSYVREGQNMESNG